MEIERSHSPAPWFRGTGTSMAPLLPKSCLLTVEACSKGPLALGEIVIYTGKDRYICHRIVVRELRGGEYWYYVLGNDPTSPDGWIPASSIIGRVTEVDGKPLPRWRTQLFYWHGFFEVAFIHKVFQSSWSRQLSKRMATHFSYRTKTVTHCFLILSALPLPQLLILRLKRRLARRS